MFIPESRVARARELELELNSLDWNVNELEHELELEDMKRTYANFKMLTLHNRAYVILI